MITRSSPHTLQLANSMQHSASTSSCDAHHVSPARQQQRHVVPRRRRIPIALTSPETQDLATRTPLMRFNSYGPLYPFFGSAPRALSVTVTVGDLWHTRLGHPSRASHWCQLPMEQPAAAGDGALQQRQKKSSAAKKAKKGGATGGRAWPAINPKKDLQVNRLKGTQLLTVPDFLTSAEAKAFVDVAESMGFTHQGSLGPLKGEAFRDNDRISVTDPLLAQALWETGINRIFTDINTAGKVATSLNPNIRLYRYVEGQRFGRHIDESVNLWDGSRTQYTLLIYLSGKGGAKDSQALVGGETVFYDHRGGIVAEVAPVQGMALLHLHGARCMLHEARVVKKNVKYVLRSDVVFA